MKNEKNLAVKDVEVVLEVLNKYLNLKEDMPYEVLQDVVIMLAKVEEDYDKTIKELLLSNSLVVKMEKFIEVIGAVGTISVEDEDKLDQSLDVLKNHLSNIKDWK